MTGRRNSRSDFRSTNRRDVRVTASIRAAGGTRFEIDLVDLSITGFRFESYFPLPTGWRVFLTIPTFAPLEAEVAWADGRAYGCRFLKPLHPAVFDTIAERHPSLR